MQRVRLRAQVFFDFLGGGESAFERSRDVALAGDAERECVAFFADAFRVGPVFPAQFQPGVHARGNLGGGLRLDVDFSAERGVFRAQVFRFDRERIRAPRERFRVGNDFGNFSGDAEQLRERGGETVVAQRVFDSCEQRFEFLRAGNFREIAFEPRDGVVGKLEARHRVELRLRERDFVGRHFFLCADFLDFGECVFPFAETRGEFFERGNVSRVGVENFELVVFAEKLLRFAGTVKIDPSFPDFGELGERGERAVNCNASRFRRVNRAAQNQLSILAGRERERVQNGVRPRGCGEGNDGFDFALLRAFADRGF